MSNEKWAADVKKYVPDADDGIIAGIVRYCGIALRKVDSSLVAFSDPKETARVRDGFCRKKLGLTDSDADVDAAIAAVGQRMKADRTKNRVTVYYLLAEHYDKLALFMPKAKTGTRTARAGAGAGAAAAAATAAGAATLMGSSGADAAPAPAPAPAPTPAAPPAPVERAAAASDATPAGLMGTAGAVAAGAAGAVAAGATAAGAAVTGAVAAGAAAATTAAAAVTGAVSDSVSSAAAATPAPAHQDDGHHAAGYGAAATEADGAGGGFSMGALLGVLALILGAALLAWFISSRMGNGDGNDGAAGSATTVAGAADGAASATPAAPAAPAAPPEGAGVVATEVAGRPMVSVYFDTASALIASDFATVVAPIKAWLDAHPQDVAQVSGFNDPRGNAAFNADLSRRRAEGVAAELRRLGVPDTQIDLEPPAAATDTTVDLAGARRVEITIVPAS